MTTATKYRQFRDRLKNCLWSSPASANEGSVTILAVLETVSMMSLALYIVCTTGNYLYIFVPAMIAPVLLLRTPESTEEGLRLYGYVVDWVKGIKAWQVRDGQSRLTKEVSLFLGFAFFLLVIPVIAIGIRTLATFLVFFHHPLRAPIKAVQAIPWNLWKIAGATDFHHPPEIVPGIETSPKNVDKRYLFSRHLTHTFRSLRGIYADRSVFFKLIFLAGRLFQIGLIYIPALSYRWSLKSTVFVWLPLVFFVKISRAKGEALAERLDKIFSGVFEKGRRYIAGFDILFLFLLPMVVFIYIDPIKNSFVDFFLFTGTVKLWHVARIVNAFIAIGLYGIADNALRRIKYGRPPNANLIHNVISVSLFIRGFLGIYLILKLLDIIISKIDWTEYWTEFQLRFVVW